MLAAIAFDLDNTLIDRDAAARLVLGEVLPAAQLDHAMLLDDSGHGDGRALFGWLADRLGEDDRSIGRWFRARLAELIAPDRHVIEAVGEIAARFRVVLVSNGGPAQRHKLARAGLTGLFSRVLVSSEIGCAKPDGAIFARAVDLLGVRAEDVLFVGDHPINDIAGAAAAGMKTCWVSRGRSYPSQLVPPDLTIRDVTRLPSIVC